MKWLLALLVLVLTTAGCSKSVTAPVRNEPAHVEVQHVLIGFQGTVPGKTITRSEDEARALAADVLARARGGEDFASLVQQYTDDQFPGIYDLANSGVPAPTGELPRGQVVKAFGDVSFTLGVGDVGVAEYDSLASPFGWHVIKRLR